MEIRDYVGRYSDTSVEVMCRSREHDFKVAYVAWCISRSIHTRDQAWLDYVQARELYLAAVTAGKIWA